MFHFNHKIPDFTMIKGKTGETTDFLLLMAKRLDKRRADKRM
jgi:hypothetical protein